MSRQTSGPIRNVGLASLGAMLEYYDFAVYVFVASLLSQEFFPVGASSWIKEIQVFSIYAIGYLVRPVAGLIIAHLADRVGRKRLFVLTVFLMSVPTLLMGLLPTYEQIGPFAPVLLLVLRIFQGSAVGGELPSAAVFVCEHAQPRRLYFSGATLQAMVNAGLLLGAGSAAIAGWIASFDPHLASLSWRLPFVAGGVCGLWAAYLRRHIEESPLFVELRQRQRILRVPLGVVLRNHLGASLYGLGMLFVQSVIVVTYFLYMPTYLVTQFHVAPTAAVTANSVGVVALVLSMAAWGWVADAIGRGKAMAAGAVLSAVVAVWFFHALPEIAARGGTGLVWALVPAGLAGGCVPGLVPPVVCALFPTAVRQSGYALPYNVGAALFAGLLPLTFTWLVRDVGVLSPVYVVLAACLVSGICAALAPHMPDFLAGKDAAGPAVSSEGPAMTGHLRP